MKTEQGEFAYLNKRKQLLI